MFIMDDMRTKVGLVSCYKDPNYGTMLQAFALWKVLQKNGVDSEYISYTYGYCGWRKCYFVFRLFMLKPIVFFKRLFGIKISSEFDFFYEDDFKTTIKAFNEWCDENIKHTEIVYNHKTISNTNNLYDSFMVGSDQTWSYWRNEEYTSSYYYYLRFVERGKKKNAYAPSFGGNYLPKTYLHRLSKYLASFNAISCREKRGVEILTECLHLPVAHVLDPTLLLDSNDWAKMMKPISMPEKYVLCYILGEKQEIADFAEKLGEILEFPVFYILTRPFYLNKRNKLDGVGPGEFLYLIKNASYVCTDSFHGTIFSINFHVPFYSFTKRKNGENNDNPRIYNILEEFSLIDRFSPNIDDILVHEIDFQKVDEYLKRRRQESLEYLKKCCM